MTELGLVLFGKFSDISKPLLVWGYHCINAPPYGGGEGGGAACLCLILFYSKSPITPSFTRLKKLVQLLLELFFEVVDCVVDLFC